MWEKEFCFFFFGKDVLGFFSVASFESGSVHVWDWPGKAWIVWERLESLPLTESVSFKAVLQRGSRVQISRLSRLQYMMEACQVLRVDVRIGGSFVGEGFLAGMTRDGCLMIAKLALKLLLEGEEESLEGCVLEVTVEPADEQVEKPGLNL
jgi:hypothetical protein